MNPARWKQIDELFDAVLELPETERESFLSSKCAGDDELKQKVLTLLAAQDQSVNFMEISAMKLMGKAIADYKENFADNSLHNKTIGTYKIEKLLGAGGMGEVYLARDTKLNRKVALKILPAEFIADDERVRRFQLEARTISALNHPNIVTIYDVGSFDGINYIATEYVEGETLREFGGGKRKLKEILQIVTQCCDALATAHSAGIIHRDIKPENIMIRPDGYVKILDFGLAKLSDTSFLTFKNLSKTAKGIIIGTPAYMSPEQVSDDRIDHRTDLWSIGVVLYELITGTNPFKKANRQATFQAILSEEPPPASSLNTEVSAELDRILAKALEKDSDLSYQNAADLRTDLKRVRREIDSSPSLRTTDGGIRNISDRKAGRSYLSYAVGAILIATAGFGIWFLFSRSNSAAIADVEWSRAKHLPLTDAAGIKTYPSLSPDGRAFIFTNRDGTNTDIFLQRIGGKTLANLTENSDADDTMGVFSPDGKFVAFRSERNPAGIYLMEETGENARRVLDFGFHPSWSPDGKKIAVSDKYANVATNHTIPNSSVWIADIETGEKKLLDTKGDAIMPSWSPNGKRIAYWFVEEGKPGEIATISPDGGEPVKLTNNDATDWNPVWSPDGKFIYFCSDRLGNMSLWRAAINENTGEVSGDPESVPTSSSYVLHPSISRDGKMISYIRYETRSNLQTINFDPQKLETSGTAEFITRGDKQISTPALSPNGAEYVARFPSRTQEDLVIFGNNGENWRNLTNDKFRDRMPRWSPDGKKIAFSSDRSGKYQIWMINADGSDLRQITFTEKTGATAPIFSPDGRRLSFSQIDGKNLSPYILDLSKTWQQQKPVALPPMPDYKNSYTVRDWSDDGEKLLLLLYETENNEEGIVVYDLKNSTYEKMTDSGSYPVWLNDNRHFMFDNRYSVEIFDIVTKQKKEIYKIPSYELQHADLSADNRRIYFRYLQADSDVWLLDASQK